MKKLYIFLFFAVALAGEAEGQSWCPTGAEWTYSYHSLNEIGYTSIKYSSDTTVQGQICKKLSVEQVIADCSFCAFTGGVPSSIDTYSREPYYTYDRDDTVYLYYANAFRPVFYFNSQVADTIEFYNYPISACGDSILLRVDSVGKVLIGNDSLRFYVAHPIHSQFVNPDTIVIVEKLGVLTHYNNDGANDLFFTILPFFSCASVLETSYSLRCYKDDEIGLFQTGTVACDFVYSGIDNNTLIPFRIFPNPASKVLFIETDVYETLQAEIYELSGRKVLSVEVKGKGSIDVQKLSPAVYQLKLTNTQRTSTKLWIKE